MRKKSQKIKSTTSKQMSNTTNSNNTGRVSMVDTDTMGGMSCDYATLARYNMRNSGQVAAPVDLTIVPSQRVQVVPVWGSYGYNSLSHGKRGYNCSGYYSITSAYPDYATNCGQYARRACAGTVMKGLK